MFALDVLFFAMSHVSTYLIFATEIPGVAEIGYGQFLINAFGLELGLIATFCIPATVSALSLFGTLSYAPLKNSQRQAVFYVSFTELAGLTPPGFLEALNDMLVLVSETNLLGALNLTARILALIIPSAANTIILLLYIEHLQKKHNTQPTSNKLKVKCHRKRRIAACTIKNT